MIRKIALFALIAVPLVALAFMGWWWRDHAASGVQTHTAEAGDVIEGVTVSGTVRCREKAAVAAEVRAAIKEISVAEGQVVRAGDALIVLDDSVVRAECAMAAAQVERAKAYLRQLRAGTRKEEIQSAREQVRQAESELEYRQKDLARLEQVVKAGGTTQSELQLARTRHRVAEAAVAEARSRLALLEAGSREEEIARAAAEVKLAEAERERCAALADKYVVRAPHAGVVTAKHVNVGEVVGPERVLLRLDNIDSIEILADAQEVQVAGFDEGVRGQVLADAYPNHPIEATVEKILPRVDPQTGTITCILKPVRSPEVVLMDGMAVDIALVRERRENVVRVPVEAVMGRAEDASVYVREGGGFRRRRISLGLRDPYWVEVTDGLEAGDVIRMP